MATNSLRLPYVLKQFQNVKSSVNKRWFAYVKSQGCLSTRGLADHMVNHGMFSNKGELLKMLSALSECIPELVAQGYSIKLDGLGIFYATIANAKGGADSVEDFDIQKNVAGVRFGFKPDSTDLDNLTYKAFKAHVSFGNGYYQTATGPKAPMIPLAAAETPEP